MILSPTPFLGWNSVYKGPANFVGFAPRLLSAGTEYTVDLDYRVSGRGLQYKPKGLKGDIADYIISGSGQPGAFFPFDKVVFNGKLILVGTIIDLRKPDFNHQARNAVFVSTDGASFAHVETPIDGTKGSSGYRGIMAVAANSDRVLVIDKAGRTAVSTDAETWTAGPVAAFTGTDPVHCLAGSDLGFVAGGINGQLFTLAANATGSWTARTSQFGTTRIDALHVGNVVAAFGQGKISTSTNLTAWTARASPSGGINAAAYNGGQWFAGGQNNFIASTDGLAWAAATKPWGDVNGTLTDIFFSDSQWFAMISVGRLSIGDGSEWTPVSNPGFGTTGTAQAIPFLA